MMPSLPLAATALTLVEALLLAFAAVALARLGWALVTPVGPVGPVPTPTAVAAPLPDALAGFDPFFRSRSGTSGGAEALSSLELTLVGTRVDQASGRGSAILTLADDVQSSFAVGDEVLPGVRLVAVSFDSVTLDNAGTREALFLDQSGPPQGQVRPVSGEVVTVAGMTGGPAPRLAADLTAAPRMAEGRLTGFVLTPKGSGAAFAAAGLRAGDVLTQIDGRPVADLGDPAALAGRIDDGGMTLTIERGGTLLKVPIPLRNALQSAPGGAAR